MRCIRKIYPALAPGLLPYKCGAQITGAAAATVEKEYTTCIKKCLHAARHCTVLLWLFLSLIMNHHRVPQIGLLFPLFPTQLTGREGETHSLEKRVRERLRRSVTIVSERVARCCRRRRRLRRTRNQSGSPLGSKNGKPPHRMT